MGIGAAETECADSGAAHSAIGRGGPSVGFTRQIESRILQIDIWVDGLQIGDRRQSLMMQGQNGLEQPGNARRRFKMADIGFDRA